MTSADVTYCCVSGRGGRSADSDALKPLKTSREAAKADPLVTIAGGVNLFDSIGNASTSTYLKISGGLINLRSNIAPEAKAKIVSG